MFVKACERKGNIWWDEMVLRLEVNYFLLPSKIEYAHQKKWEYTSISFLLEENNLHICTLKRICSAVIAIVFHNTSSRYRIEELITKRILVFSLSWRVNDFCNHRKWMEIRIVQNSLTDYYPFEGARRRQPKHRRNALFLRPHSPFLQL